MYSTDPFKYGKRLQTSDAVVFALLGLGIYGLIATAQRWQGVYQPDFKMDLALSALPLYGLYSLFRAMIAYSLSLSFTLIFGYLAAKNRFAEKLIVPLLDIGQSIPVLGFLPGLVLGLVAVFPKTNIGLELACIIMIFTGQVWNMTFSYISSLKAVPTQLHEMADNIGLGRVQKLLSLELPCAATGLAWNSLMSMAGGWFFLTVCEAFTLGDKNFRVPGLGSYMALAIEQNNHRAMFAGVFLMIFIIVFMDFVIWRPIIAWTARFRLSESNESLHSDIPFMSLLLKGSPFFQRLIDLLNTVLIRAGNFRIKDRTSTPNPLETFIAKNPRGQRRRLKKLIAYFNASKFFQFFIIAALIVIGFVIAGKVYQLVETLHWNDWRDIFVATSFTFMRVLAALLIASLWAIPAGIWIGLSPKLTRAFQPFIQVGASFPAPMLYPLALGIFNAMGLELSISSSFLMLLGVQWYVLFNVLAGAIGISQDLRESFRLIGLTNRTKWMKLYLPSIFPALVTGWVTAAGGAWNASIVSEYVIYQGHTLKTRGLGAMISEATNSGNFHILAACLIVMIVTVVSINRLGWSRVYQIAETRFRFER
ncbi:MAG: ABC transporter permease subunit [Methylotenera sp.]|nr:ABC transporter permease subunit [Oligoflexia bacterium]